MDFFVIIAIFINLSVIMFLAFLISHNRQENKKISILAISAEAIHAQKISGKRYRFRLENTEFEYRYFPGAKNSPPSLTLITRCAAPGDFSVSRETAFDRFFKRLGIAVELSTSDTEFDSKVYIKSNDIPFIQRYFQDHRKREAVLALQKLDCTQVTLNGKMLKIVCSPFLLERLESESFLNEVAKYMSVLVQDMPQNLDRSIFWGIPVWQSNRAFIFSMAVLSLLVGVVCSFWMIQFDPLDDGKIFIYGLKFTLPALLVFVFFSVVLLKGRSNSHNELVTSTVLGIIGLALCSLSVPAYINGKYDPGRSIVHTVTVIDKYTTRSKNHTSYYVRVQSWRPNRSSELFSVSRSRYYSLNAYQSQVAIETKPGHLGFEWVVRGI